MDQLSATKLWCNITNALIRKYKTMSEEKPKMATEELLALRRMLISMNFLTEGELYD